MVWTVWQVSEETPAGPELCDETLVWSQERTEDRNSPTISDTESDDSKAAVHIPWTIMDEADYTGQ